MRKIFSSMPLIVCLIVLLISGTTWVLIESQGKVFANGREQVVQKKEFERVLTVDEQQPIYMKGAAFTQIGELAGNQPVSVTGEDEAYYELRLGNMPVFVRTMVGIAQEERTDSMYIDYLSGELTGDYSPEQYFDLYLYDDLLGFGSLPETPVFAQINRLGELFLEASYRTSVPVSQNEVEIRYQYGREGVAEQVFTMTRDRNSGRWPIQEQD